MAADSVRYKIHVRRYVKRQVFKHVRSKCLYANAISLYVANITIENLLCFWKWPQALVRTCLSFKSLRGREYLDSTRAWQLFQILLYLLKEGLSSVCLCVCVCVCEILWPQWTRSVWYICYIYLYIWIAGTLASAIGLVKIFQGGFLGGLAPHPLKRGWPQ